MALPVFFLLSMSRNHYYTVPQISRAQGQFVKSDKIAKKLSKMCIWASKIKFRKISMRNFENDCQY